MFNYDGKYRGVSAKAASSLKDDKELSQDGFFVNHARVLIGSGVDSFEKGKNALKTWRFRDFFYFFLCNDHVSCANDGRLIQSLCLFSGILVWIGHLLIQRLLYKAAKISVFV